MIDKQSELIIAIQQLLAEVDEFGGAVIEDSVLRVIDAEDSEWPASFIVLQPGQTEEVERVNIKSLRERFVVNVTLVTSKRDFAPLFRAGRLAVKSVFSGRKAGLEVAQEAGFLAETPMPPTNGRQFAAHVMPLQITYVQNY